LNNKTLNIALIEGFFTGSHKRWANEFKSKSSHNIQIFSLPGRFWKWRMHGGAISLADQLMASDFQPDIILATDMIDLALFLSLTKNKTKHCPIFLYFHENQLSYPWSPTDPDVQLNRDNHYAFINYSSALVADFVVFNSTYHHDSFLDALPEFLTQFPDHNNLETVQTIRQKSKVIPLGFTIPKTETIRNSNHSIKTILWNHRWEYDKSPEVFFQSIYKLQNHKIPFKLIVIGEQGKKYPDIFDEAKARLSDHIIHWGYVEEQEKYKQLLQESDILPVCSIQDFFGISIVEAILAGVTPLLPNRLAYPEHIEKHMHDIFLYDNEHEMNQKLQSFLIHDPLPKVSPNTLSHYKWKSVLEQWEDAFKTLQL